MQILNRQLHLILFMLIECQGWSFLKSNTLLSNYWKVKVIDFEIYSFIRSVNLHFYFGLDVALCVICVGLLGQGCWSYPHFCGMTWGQGQRLCQGQRLLKKAFILHDRWAVLYRDSSSVINKFSSHCLLEFLLNLKTQLLMGKSCILKFT